jgi:hypothetical protein
MSEAFLSGRGGKLIEEGRSSYKKIIQMTSQLIRAAEHRQVA